MDPVTCPKMRAHHSGNGIISVSFSIKYKIIPEASVTFAFMFNEFISSESLTDLRLSIERGGRRSWGWIEPSIDDE